MSGLNASTGRALSGIDHIWQSCRDIITTPIGSRIERRDYGSFIPELIDHPHNPANNLRLRAATVMALAKWEPRITIRNVAITLDIEQGSTSIELEAVTKQGTTINATLPLTIGGLK